MPRLAPDLFDQIVWPLTETSGAYRSVGQFAPNSSVTDLTVTNTIVRTGTGIFGGNAPSFPSANDVPIGAAATRNFISGANTYNPSPPFTLSCWVYLRSYTTAQNAAFIRKEYRDTSITNSWSTPFMAIGMQMQSTNFGGDWQVNIATNNTTQVSFTVSDFPVPIGVWSHIGFTHDGSAIRLYLNGCQMMFYSGATQNLSLTCAAPSYTDGTNGFGKWVIGSITATGSTNKEEPAATVQDVRIANIVRSLSYFRKVYAAGALPLISGSFTNNQFYKLRAYDLSCPTPTAVTWVDTQVSLANAPAFPCSGPYSPIEVIDTWYV